MSSFRLYMRSFHNITVFFNQSSRFVLKHNHCLRMMLTRQPVQYCSMVNAGKAEGLVEETNPQKHHEMKDDDNVDFLEGNNALADSISVLHTCFLKVKSYNEKDSISFKFSQEDGSFSCDVTIEWPYHQEFSGTGSTKKSAKRRACEKALAALWKSRHITSKGEPLLIKPVVRAPLNQPKITLSTDERRAIADLQDHFQQVEPFLESAKALTANDFAVSSLGQTLDVIYGRLRSDPIFSCDKSRRRRSSILRERLSRPRLKTSLPIDKYRAELIEAVENHRVVLLRTETGGGKSSRYPQIILDHYISQGRGADCNIVVTQPRRLTTVSLAHFVAKERNESLGDTVGYSVRLDTITPRPPGGSIFYCTTGKLLQIMTTNPYLDGVSHICVDEVHERQCETDLLMYLLRRVLQKNQNIHVTLMSATLNSDEFRDYFGSESHIFEAPGRMFPVETFFLEDLPKEIVKPYTESDQFHMIARVVKWLDEKKPGAILVFLPGWKEIQIVNTVLQQEDNLHIVLLHSIIPLAKQMKVFQPAPEGMRKVVLATNIAESSVTVPDVVYVVDYPYERIGSFSYEDNEMNYSVKSCPQSRLLQRRGRAGRVRAGECYHLMSKESFEKQPMSTTPAILQMSLEYPVLLARALVQNETIYDIFLDLLTPPPIQDISDGLASLQELGALDADQTLTSLGMRMLTFGLEPRAAKAMALSAVLKCENCMSAYVATSELFPVSIFSTEPNALVSYDVHPTSDHMVLINLLHMWIETHESRASWKAIKESSKISLSYEDCHHAYEFMRMLLKRLQHAEILLDPVPDCLEPGELHKEELLKGVLLHVHRNIAFAKTAVSKRHLRQRITVLSGKPLVLPRRGVNGKKKKLSSPFLLYMSGIDVGPYVVTAYSSLMSPISVLLFMPGTPEIQLSSKNSESEDDRIISLQNNKIRIELSKDDCDLLLSLRKAIADCVDYFLRKQGTSEEGTMGYGKIREFRAHLIDLLEELLDARSPTKVEESSTRSNETNGGQLQS